MSTRRISVARIYHNAVKILFFLNPDIQTETFYGRLLQEALELHSASQPYRAPKVYMVRVETLLISLCVKVRNPSSL